MLQDCRLKKLHFYSLSLFCVFSNVLKLLAREDTYLHWLHSKCLQTGNLSNCLFILWPHCQCLLFCPSPATFTICPSSYITNLQLHLQICPSSFVFTICPEFFYIPLRNVMVQADSGMLATSNIRGVFVVYYLHEQSYIYKKVKLPWLLGYQLCRLH